MATVTHSKVSGAGPASSPSLVGGDDWDAAHVLDGLTGFEYVQEAQPGSPVEGGTWLRLPPAIDPDSWEAATLYPAESRVIPTTPNGHWYRATTGGTSDASEPTWPTDGSSVSDGTVEWLDEGLVSGQTIPTTGLPLYQYSDDLGWVAVLPQVWGSGQNLAMSHYDPDGRLAAFLRVGSQQVWAQAGRTQYTLDQDQVSIDVNTTDDNDLATEVFFNANGSTIRGAYLRVGNGSMDVHWMQGTADPSAGGGVAANVASLYSRDNSGTGELWVKTGSSDTAWTKVV